MREINDRPICHRSEDLVTYLYGEATAVEAQDFSAHVQQCDACRVEFEVFNQVHDSIVTWRNEALGGLTFHNANTTSLMSAASETNSFFPHERKLSALAALRQFFAVSPFWLRGATVFAGLLLCGLLLTLSRSWQRSTNTAQQGNEAKYSQPQLDQEVQRQVKERVAALMQESSTSVKPASQIKQPTSTQTVPHVAVNHSRSGNQRAKGLNRQEREQLAADLGLIPRRDEELPFVLPEQPN